MTTFSSCIISTSQARTSSREMANSITVRISDGAAAAWLIGATGIPTGHITRSDRFTGNRVFADNDLIVLVKGEISGRFHLALGRLLISPD